MKEYIDREAVIKHLDECKGTPPEICYTWPIYGALECFVKDIPAADVVEVVRCKDCKYYKPESRNGKVKYCCRSAFVKVGEMDFCSYGERKEDETN